MKQYTAVVRHSNGVVTKFQDFDAQADAAAHVAIHGGNVVVGLDDSLIYWDVSGDSPVKDTNQYQADMTASKWESLRTKRNRLLAETDYHAMTDTTLTDSMKSYRQALRDLPANTANPDSPSWPSKP